MASMPPIPPGVNTGRPCPKYHDGTIKRLAIPARVRREVALRHGAIPGQTTDAACVYCGAPGSIYWPTLASGAPGSWVSFSGLSLEHIYPYSRGGSNSDPDNFTIACKRCNSSKGASLPGQWKGLA